MTVETRLKAIRTTRGISAAELAQRACVSRQTIYAIEQGSFIPNTAVSLRLARALDVAVEEIFSIAPAEESGLFRAELLSDRPAGTGQPVKLCRVNERLMAIPVSGLPAYLPSTDGIIESHRKLRISVKSPMGLPEEGRRLLLAGCDPALSLFQDALSGSGFEIVTIPCSSRLALEWLKQGRVHAAGSHLLDHATGDYNLPIIRGILPESSVRVVTFATWEQGLVVQHGNPKRLQSITDLAARSVKFINREKGSGSRDLLDSGLREFGIRQGQVQGYESIASGHLAAAYSIATGRADCCIAPQSAARCFGLDFVPLTAQRFDLAFSRATLDLPAAKALLDRLNRAGFRKKLECIAGYDTTHTGEVLM